MDNMEAQAIDSVQRCRAVVVASDAGTRQFVGRVLRQVGIDVVEPEDEVTAATLARQGARSAVVKVELPGVGADGGALAVDSGQHAGQGIPIDEQARLQCAAMDASANAIYIADREGVVTWVNPAFVALTGYDREEVLGHSLRVIQREDDQEVNCREAWDAVLAGETWRGRLVNRRKDGSLYHENMMAAPIRDEHGHVTHVVAITRDATDEVEAEALLQQNSERLRRANADLTKAHQAAEQARQQVEVNNADLIEAQLDAQQARRDAERALEELKTTQQQLIDASRQAGMAEVATSVLHNVGNVLNSVIVSAGLVTDTTRQTKATSLGKVVTLLRENREDLASFLTRDERGARLPEYLATLAEHLADEQTAVMAELKSLTGNIEHIRDIIATQQTYAGVSGVTEVLDLAQVADDALRLGLAGAERHGIRITREYATLPPITVERHKLLQILTNLLRNASHALLDRQTDDKRLIVRIVPTRESRLSVEIIDNGIGIPPENLTRIFAHGFTTKKTGHGFGLHGSALAAKEMGGTLSAFSEGAGRGAAFVLELPLPARESEA